jgi:hypothetical protein
MLLRNVVGMTLIICGMGLAKASDSNVFTVRSYVNPQTKKEVPYSPQILDSKNLNEIVTAVNQGLKRVVQCASPLRELKAESGEKIDPMGLATGPGSDPITKVSPVPACEGWK